MSHTTRILGDDGTRWLARRTFELQVVSGPDSGLRAVIDEPRALVGTAPENQLVLRDPAVSRHHLRITVERNGFVVTDLASTNGSFLGDVRIGEIVIRSATTIRLGSTRLVVRPLSDERRVELPSTDRCGALVGSSPEMLGLFAELQRVAPSPANVLISGETGTGKELLAGEIHRLSDRSRGPLEIVDCAAIPPSLIESELFGYRRGAFTGAAVDHAGCFERATGGTVFLDEIGELDIALQPRLLRVLESGRVKRLGDDAYRRIDIRVIAATHRDLDREVSTGAFRSDLYYRLAVVLLHIPPLRRRPEDIEPLARLFVAQLAERYGIDDPPELDPDTIAQLRAHPWRGNVRELRNFVERLLVHARGSAPIDPFEDLQVRSPVSEMTIEELTELAFSEAKARWTAQFDVAYLSQMLARCNYNVAEVARRSGINRPHLFRLIKKYGIKRPPS